MRVPAHKRLRELPEVFTTNTLAATLGGDLKSASVYLSRWRKEGLISSIGPRAKLHFNLLLDPRSERDQMLDAVAYLYPGAVIAGASAVHAAGWTTQIPRSTEIMVINRRSLVQINDFVIESRPISWFKEARKRIYREGPVPVIDPGFALADLWKTGSWRPDPDDLEWDMIDLSALERDFAEFGLELPSEWREEAEYSGPRYAP